MKEELERLRKIESAAKAWGRADDDLINVMATSLTPREAGRNYAVAEQALRAALNSTSKK